mmetsp:Transcript_15341/g.17748  ORF Transcript_15341/g.17748 Transcript_15341/m.17748 type:complete len:145 (-) Transcript_15341:187-621(-)
MHTTYKTPTVQKYSTTNRFLPLLLAGRISANMSNGTHSPPTPTPTMNKLTRSTQYEFTVETTTPKKLIIEAANKKTILLPFLSASGPKVRVPNIAPVNNIDVIKAVSASSKFHSIRSTSLRKDNSKTCIASAAKHRPTAVRTTS